MSCSSGGLSVRLSLCNSAAPTGQISVIFSTGGILINKENPNLVKSGQNLSCILHEALILIYYIRQSNFATKVLLCNMLYCYIVNSTCSPTVTTKNYGYANAPQRDVIRSLPVLLPGALRGMGEVCCTANPYSRVEGKEMWRSK